MTSPGPPSATPPRLREAFAICGALALHVVLIVLAAHRGPDAPRPAAPERHEADVEVELVAPVPEVPSNVGAGAPDVGQGDPSPASAAARHRTSIAHPSAPEALAPSIVEPESVAPLASGGIASQRPIDLGLEGGVLRDALSNPDFLRKKAPQPSVGLLSEGLAQMGAAAGVSRSSAAVSAAYQSASEYAPAAGLALFDVVADASGAVVSVTLASDGPDQARWTRVADALRAQLSKRKLRVPAGASGLVTRLRIERGRHAEGVGAANRLERGAAMGQEALPPGMAADESTQSSLNGGLTPTLGIYSTAKKARATRVVIVSERVL